MTINHATVLPKVAEYLSKDEGTFYSIKDIFDLVPFDEEDNATLRGLCFTLGNMIVGEPKKDPYYEGAEHLYKMILYSNRSNTKSYITFERDSKFKKKDFLAFLKEQKGDIYRSRKVKLHEDEETKEIDITIFKGTI